MPEETSQTAILAAVRDDAAFSIFSWNRSGDRPRRLHAGSHARCFAPRPAPALTEPPAWASQGRAPLVTGFGAGHLRSLGQEACEGGSGRGVTTKPVLPSGGERILVVDDDGEIRSLVARFLRELGHEVATARDGVEMRERLGRSSFDLIILDVMLPGTGGLDLCREIRARSAVPVIMLTARGDELDRVLGLEIGADDYVAKPFSPRELAARIRAVLRRARPGGADGGAATARPTRMLRFAGWTLDTMRRELTNPAGVLVDVSTGEYDLLLAFLEAPNRVLSRDHLLEASRHRLAEGFDRSVDVQVSRLRRKIEPGERAPEMIRTVRGAGYLFAPDVERA